MLLFFSVYYSFEVNTNAKIMFFGAQSNVFVVLLRKLRMFILLMSGVELR